MVGREAKPQQAAVPAMMRGVMRSLRLPPPVGGRGDRDRMRCRRRPGVCSSSRGPAPVPAPRIAGDACGSDRPNARRHRCGRRRIQAAVHAAAGQQRLRSADWFPTITPMPDIVAHESPALRAPAGSATATATAVENAPLRLPACIVQ